MRKRLFLALFVSVLGWIFLEQVAKWSLAQNVATDSVAMPYDAYLLWKLGIGSHQFGRLKAHINDDGYREIPINEDVQDQIVFLGDSSTFGFEVPVEDTFAYKTAKCLGMKPVNAAVPGYTSTQSMLQWQRLSLDVQPKILVVASLWSDLVQTKYPDSKLFSEQLQVSSWQTWLYHHSYVYQWLYEHFQTDNNADRNQIFWQRLLKGEDQRSFSPRVPPKDYERNLNEIFSLSTDVQRVMLLLPTNVRMGQPREAKEYRLIAQKIAQQHGALVVDMDDFESDFSLRERFLDVVHPSVLGHAEIAEKLCERLQH